MGFFGFSSKKEVAEKEAAARAQGARSVIQSQQNSLSNLSKGSQIKFAVPYFDVFDPRFDDFGVPVSVHGTIIYAIEDIDKFNSKNKSGFYNDEVFESKLKGQLCKYIKSVVCNAPIEHQIQVLQLERKIVEIGHLIQILVAPQIENLFGVTIKSIDVTSIMVDKSSRGYRELKSVTTDLEKETLTAKNNIGISNMRFQSDLQQDQMRRMQEMNLGGQEEIQRMQLEHQRETMRIQREELQRASRLQTETNFLSAHQANLNAGMSQMGAPMMTPQVQYMVGINGQPAGPFDWNQLSYMVQEGQLTQQSQVWKQGMSQWALAGQVQELQPLFTSQSPSMNGMPPLM